VQWGGPRARGTAPPGPSTSPLLPLTSTLQAAERVTSPAPSPAKPPQASQETEVTQLREAVEHATNKALKLQQEVEQRDGQVLRLEERLAIQMNAALTPDKPAQPLARPTRKEGWLMKKGGGFGVDTPKKGAGFGRTPPLPLPLSLTLT
jgi:hypothetical protein